MHYLVDSEKSLYETTVDLRAAILRLGFSILDVQELGGADGGWSVECDEDCTVFAVDNARYTAPLLAGDMRCALALPWKISVYTDAGNTRLGLVCPQPLLAALGVAPTLLPLAGELENKLRQMVDDAR